MGRFCTRASSLYAVCIRYGWALPNLPATCACGTSFSVQHALDCKLGGLRVIQHNETRDVVAQCMREAGHSLVEVEPQLQELSGEVFEYKSANKEADARSDIKCCGFWSNKLTGVFRCEGGVTFCQKLCSFDPRKPFQAGRTREDPRVPRAHSRSRTWRLQPSCVHVHWWHGPHNICQIVMEAASRAIVFQKKNIQQSVVSGWSKDVD